MSALTAAPRWVPATETSPNIATRILNWLANHSRGADALRQYHRLDGLSDAELARRGLKREDLLNRAFSPYYSG